VNPNATPEEVAAVVEQQDGGNQVFSQAVRNNISDKNLLSYSSILISSRPRLGTVIRELHIERFKRDIKIYGKWSKHWRS